VTAHVVVIGGGLAGTSAALHAADAGAAVTLLERRSKLGGLTWSFRRNGRWFDNGQHVFLRCCDAYVAFLERIGAADQVMLQPSLDLPVLRPGRPGARIWRSNAPAPAHLARCLAGYTPLSVAERIRLVAAMATLRRLDPADPTLDFVRFGAWLAAHGQSARSVEALWDLVILPTVNVHAQDASLAMAVKVLRTGLLDDNDGCDLGWSRIPLGELHGTMAVDALERAGVDVRLQAPVSAVRDVAGTLEVTAASTIRADAVILATAPETARALAPAGALAPLELGTSPIVNVHVVFDRRVTDLHVAACIDSPVQFVFDHTQAAGETRGQCLTVSLSAADAYIGVRPEVLISTFTAALGEVIPAARTARVVDAVVTREHAATFRAAPGTAASRPAPPTAVPGLFVAGAWCETGWPATMEGAVRSGTRAAAEALASVPHIPAGATAGTLDPQLQEAMS
jgi:hydroxysqualene dehydroxylase